MEKDKIEKLCRDSHIDILILFGSQAKKDPRVGSDHDIAFKPGKGFGLNKLDLIYRLGELYNIDDIDLVRLTPDTDPVLLWEIFMHGKPLFERHPGLFEKEKLKAWKIYQDTAKIRNLRKEHLKQSIRKAKDVARSLK